MAEASFLASGWLQISAPTAAGNYIVDFVCLQKRLIIEVDGGQHAPELNHDAERDAWLRAQGFSILKFWNNDVLKNIDGVVEMIVKSLQSTPYLNPSPQGGRTKMQSKNSDCIFGKHIFSWSSGHDQFHLTHH
jgi:very-short-patch-repair endonuclease